MKAASREQLLRFVERSDRVERSAYVKRVLDQGGTKLTINWTSGQGGSITTTVPNEEEVDALVLTARMFVQNNDPISFGNLARLDTDPGISAGWKEQMCEAREKLNDHLDADSLASADGARLTNRDIFYTFLYGGLAHTDPKRGPLFRQWKSNPVVFATMEFAFHATLFRLAHTVRCLGAYTKMELAGQEVPPIPRGQV